MPSFLIGGAGGLCSGGVNILSGYGSFWSGQGAYLPATGWQLRASRINSGNLYVGFSGNITITSGGVNTSGLPNASGLMDGMQLGPGDSYFVQKGVFAFFSGNPRIFVVADAACSGQGRVFAEAI